MNRKDEAKVLAIIERAIRRDARFPEWPFQADRGAVHIVEFGVVLGGRFGPVIDALTDSSRDAVTAVLAIPRPTLHFDPEAFTALIPQGEAAIGYAEAVWSEPDGKPVDAVVFSTDYLAVVGDSGQWAVWAERDWEIGLLITPDRQGPWLDAGAAVFDWDPELFEDIRSPKGYGMPISQETNLAFGAMLRQRDLPEPGSVGFKTSF